MDVRSRSNGPSEGGSPPARFSSGQRPDPPEPTHEPDASGTQAGPIIRGKRVLVMGLGRSGRATAICLAKRGAIVTVTDLRPPAAFKAEIAELMAYKVGLELGAPINSIREASFFENDLVVVSPGVPWDAPLLVAARKRRVRVVPEIEVASWFLAQPILGITGSNGKTTTTTLVGKMLEASGFHRRAANFRRGYGSRRRVAGDGAEQFPTGGHRKLPAARGHAPQSQPESFGPPP